VCEGVGVCVCRGVCVEVTFSGSMFGIPMCYTDEIFTKVRF